MHDQPFTEGGDRFVRITILVDCYLPSPKSIAKHVHDLGVEFCRLGHQVTIVSTTHEIAGNIEISLEDGLRIVRLRTGRIKGAIRPLRALQEVRLSSIIWRRAGAFLANNPADLVVFCSPTIFLGELIRRLKSIWSCKTYMILWDIFPQWAVDAGILRRGLIYRYFRKKEIEQYEAADRIGVQLPGDLEYFARNFPTRPYHLEVLSNWTALEEHGLPKTYFRAKLGLQDKIVFIFGGNLGVAQDVDNILRLACNLSSHPMIHLLLVGEGSEASRLQKAIDAKKLRNIQLLPPVDQRTYLSLLGEFDLGLISLDRRLTTHNIPGKLLGYLYSGMPVLASINPGNDLFEFFRTSQAGFCFLNGEDEKLCTAALQLARDEKLRIRMGKNARQLLLDKFSVQSAAQKILKHFVDVTQTEGVTKVLSAVS